MSRILSTRVKLLASAALLAAAAGAAGLGTFGSYTSTTSASQAITTGTVTIGLGAAGSSDNRLTVAATGVIPGDTIQRAIKLTNSGSENLAGITLSTAATPSTTVLTTDTTNGLQVKIEKCSVAWVESGNGTTTPYTYSNCSGTMTTVVAQRAILGTNLALTGLSSMTAGGIDLLRVTMTLPTSADNNFQGLAASVNFTFNATQRAATGQ